MATGVLEPVVCFVAHKVAAFGRLINHFGAYLNHLAILSEDPTIKSTNRQKLKGYLLQWHSAKMLFGCALFHDLLKLLLFSARPYRMMGSA